MNQIIEPIYEGKIASYLCVNTERQIRKVKDLDMRLGTKMHKFKILGQTLFEDHIGTSLCDSPSGWIYDG